jgi:hypothetical protein
MKSYIYTLNQFPNSMVNIDNLTIEIEQSTIVIALDSINLVGNNCIIIFKNILSNDEVIILNYIVTNHNINVNYNNSPTTVTILEQYYKTMPNNNFKATSINVKISATTGYYNNFITFPYDVSLICTEWFSTADDLGNSICFNISPDTYSGYITQNVNSGDTYITVSALTFDLLIPGYYLKINSESLGEITKVDIENNRIYFENPPKNNYLVNDNAKIYSTVSIIDDYYFSGIGKTEIGKYILNSQYVPANTKMELVYNNNNGLAHTFSALVEIFY